MIQRLTHTCLYVLDQDRALDFYQNKLGFEIRTDSKMGDFRWVTVGPKTQPDLEIVLLPVRPGPMIEESSCAAVRALLAKGLMWGGVLETADCQKTYEELSAKGVAFKGPPVERPYGVEAVMQDDSGNTYSVIQRPRR